jgi:hypothetical protein
MKSARHCGGRKGLKGTVEEARGRGGRRKAGKGERGEGEKGGGGEGGRGKGGRRGKEGGRGRGVSGIPYTHIQFLTSVLNTVQDTSHRIHSKAGPLFVMHTTLVPVAILLPFY